MLHLIFVKIIMKILVSMWFYWLWTLGNFYVCYYVCITYQYLGAQCLPWFVGLALGVDFF